MDKMTEIKLNEAIKELVLIINKPCILLGMKDVKEDLVSRGNNVELFYVWTKRQMSRREYDKILNEEHHFMNCFFKTNGKRK